MKTILIVVITAAVVLGGSWAVTHYMHAAALAKDDATPVRVEPAQQGTLVEIVSAPGTIQPLTKVQISAKVSARITELPYVEGATVLKGNDETDPKKKVEPSVLARLDDKDLKAALLAAQARYDAQDSQIKVSQSRLGVQEQTIRGAEFQFADAKRDLERQKALLATKDVSQATVDSAQAKVDNLDAALNGARQSLEADKTNVIVLQHTLAAVKADVTKAEEDLSYTTITSPIDGVVTRLNAKVGEVAVTGILNSAGTVLMEVGDLSAMLMVAKVDDNSVAALKPKQKATVRIPAYHDRVFEGVVDTIALTNTEDKDGSKYFETKIRLATGGERIYSGLTADADIQTSAHADAIMVPSQAVLGRSTDELPEDVRQKPQVDRSKSLSTVVYRFVNGQAVVTPVTVGPSDATRTQITSGLAAGELVITGPFQGA